MARTAREDLALKLAVVLGKAQAAVQAHAAAHAASHGLTLGEFAVLEALYHKGDLLLGELQRKILVSTGGITYLVDRLEGKGLVRRLDCPTDRRARYASLTREGSALIERIFPEHAEWLERALAGLTLAEQRTAIGLLRALGQHAEAGGREAAAEAS
ncbi:MAG TPA: MarR family transcriptional regulator [Gemmatimonadales bacterium]|nr:MarR family transcriptional regulator [Gemmatimonadales bacterium]